MFEICLCGVVYTFLMMLQKGCEDIVHHKIAIGKDMVVEEVDFLGGT